MNRRRQQKNKKKNMPTIHKVFITLIIIASAAILALLAYGVLSDDFDFIREREHEPDDDENGEIVVNTPWTTPIPREDILVGIDHYNPLTGVTMDLGLAQRRPLAIVLNNISTALPMNGVSNADIIYEYPVEGGLSRMLALYQDFYGVEKVGSIRSARHYTVQLAGAYDSILLAAGRSPLARTEVINMNIPFLNEVEGPLRDVFFRDRNRIPDRRVDSVHSVVTTSERVLQWLPAYDFRQTHEEDYSHGFIFTEDGTPQDGAVADRIVANISSGKSTAFTYDAAEKIYHVTQYNRDFVDANDNSQPAFSNVLILKMSVTRLRNDSSGRLDIVTTGSGDGYFAYGGKYIEITWSRDSVTSPFTYTLKNGEPLELGIGKSFICIIPTTQSATFG
ncbi:MAG: DUF3048 domain-containing protein [Oscillospiraceae bacterium]|jgi:hypothetical protein|nr:DUF3048 domain-containing protein [Oscillospiraceae bacterium]